MRFVSICRFLLYCHMVWVVSVVVFLFVPNNWRRASDKCNIRTVQILQTQQLQTFLQAPVYTRAVMSLNNFYLLDLYRPNAWNRMMYHHKSALKSMQRKENRVLWKTIKRKFQPNQINNWNDRLCYTYHRYLFIPTYILQVLRCLFVGSLNQLYGRTFFTMHITLLPGTLIWLSSLQK